MANNAATNLVLAQTKLKSSYSEVELRGLEPVIFKYLARFTDIMFPDWRTEKMSDDRVIEASYFARVTQALGAARSHNHTGPTSDTGVMTPSWLVNSDNFSNYLKGGNNNTYNSVEQMEASLRNVFLDFSAGLEALAANFVFSSRTGVNVYAKQGAFNVGTFTFDITEATEGARAVQISKTAMGANGYKGPVTYICDTVSFDKFENDSNQGSGNSVNKSFQFGGVNYIKSFEMDALADGLGYTKGFWVVVPDGTASVLPWIPLQNRQGVQTSVNKYGTIVSPIDGQLYGTHVYETRADGTAVNSETQDVKTEVQLSLDTAFEHAPQTTVNATPLFAFGLI